MIRTAFYVTKLTKDATQGRAFVHTIRRYYYQLLGHMKSPYLQSVVNRLESYVLVFLATLVILHGDGKASLPHVLVIYHGRSGVFALWGLVVISCILLRTRHVFILPTVGASLVIGWATLLFSFDGFISYTV